MSLCHDFQKWTIMTMLAILTVCLVGMINLAFGQNLTEEAMKLIDEASNASANATYIDDPTTDWNETANPERVEAEFEKRQQEQQAMNAIKQTHEFILNNCLEHSDRPNPVQDLIDKGFLDEQIWKNETCKSVKQMYDMTR